MLLSDLLRVPFSKRYLTLVAATYTALAILSTVLLLTLGARATERTGLNRAVYPQANFLSRPILSGVSRDLTLDFLSDYPNLPRRFFSVRWQGFWYLPETTTLNLHGTGDDRLDVWIDGDLVVRRTPPSDMHTQIRTLTLGAGVHELVVAYEQHGGAYAMELVHSFPFFFFRTPERALPYRYLFPEPPAAPDIRLAERVVLLERVVLFVWLAPILLCAAFLTRRIWKFRADVGPYSPAYQRLWKRAFHVVAGVVLVIITLITTLGRVPGWNPESLRHDDLVYGTIIRSDLFGMLTVPIHVAPGLFVLWRGFYELLPDPEWSLQVFPLACALASIPVVALAVRHLINDYSLALLAAGVTALNPLVARYSVAVHQYSFDFLVTALFLLAATRLCPDWPNINSRLFMRVAFAGGTAPFFSVPSVFISFPTIHLAALVAATGWRRRRRQAATVLLTTVAYDLAILTAYLLFRTRTNSGVRGRFGDGFLQLDSLGALWSFLADNGQRALASSLPNWDFVPWLLPLIAIGAVWLVTRRETRFVGLVALGTSAAFLAASALSVYPLGTGRPDIFFLPVPIVLFAAGLHFVTAVLRLPSIYRLILATVVSWLAIVSPLRVEYPNPNPGAFEFVDTIATRAEPGDGLVLTWPAGFPVGFYGPWDVDVLPFDQSHNATQTRVKRDRTLHLPRYDDGSQVRLLGPYLTQSPPERIWFGSSREPEAWLSDVLGAFEDHGYKYEEVLETTRYKLWLVGRR